MQHSAAQILNIAEAVREACIAAAKRGFDDAAISGLCHDGATECAIGAIKALDLVALVEAAQSDASE